MSGLTGKRVVVTRAAHQSAELAAALAGYGATPLLYPCLAVLPPADTAPLDAALRQLATFDWLLLTSANAVATVASQLDTLGLSLPATVRVGAVGAATAHAARAALGCAAATLPDEYRAAALAAALPDVAGARVLVPLSALGDDALGRALAARGAAVSEIVAYRVGPGTGGVDLPRLLAAGEVDAVTLTSGSAVTNLLARLAAEGGGSARLADVTIACIGERTSQAARHWGLRVDVTAAPHTVAGLCAALEAYFATAAHERARP
ncbi:MAG TPA: uroporphyrinogen-III synthase [Ktedonobacterales bacterium]|nr:uroporphyrinogen-III synthase [Ktedonobacterales bacterium]